MRRLLFFLSIISVLLVLSGLYLGRRLLAGSHLFAANPAIVWTGLSIFLMMVFMGPMLSRILPENMAGRLYAVRWTINMTMAVFFSLLFYMLTVDLILLLVGFFVPAEVSLALQQYALGTVALLVAVTLIGGSLQALTPKIYRVDVPLPDLPPDFDGYKIAQISDLHIGEMIRSSYVEKVVRLTNELGADAVVLTGDIIDGKLQQTAANTALLSGLRSKDGSFYVTGNHEYYWGIEHALSEMKKTGARILINQHAVVSRGESAIAIVGLPDMSSGSTPGHRSDPKKALAGLPANMTKIVLAHQPQAHHSLAGHDVQLQLSGHTHGGQFFPWSLVVRLFQHYNKGLIRHDKMWIYVNRGTATWGPRLRFGIPPEITLLTLRRAT